MVRWVASFVVAVLVTSVGATLVTPMGDDALATHAEAVVEGEVVRVAAHDTASSGIETRVRLRIDRVVAGVAAGRHVVVRVPGGSVGHTTRIVFGAPAFVTGDVVRVALIRRRDGVFAPLGLGAGVRWLTPSRLREIADDASIGPAFTFFTGRPFRWIRGGRPVRFRIANTDAVLGDDATFAAIDAAMDVWSAIPTSTIAIERRGPIRPQKSISQRGCNRRNVIQFDDPKNELPDLSGCSGTLGITGVCGITGKRLKLTEADVTINRGVADCLGDAGMREVLTHELGHAIGLGHSSERFGEPDFGLADATMFWLIHGDGRGAALRADDVDGASGLYP